MSFPARIVPLGLFALVLAVAIGAFWWLNAGGGEAGDGNAPPLPTNHTSPTPDPAGTGPSVTPEAGMLVESGRHPDLGPGLCGIRGRVVDGRGQALPGATVSLHYALPYSTARDPRAASWRGPDLERSLTVAADGAFAFLDLPQVEGCRVQAVADGHEALERRVTLQRNRVMDLGSFLLRAGATVRGRVHGEQGEVVAQARIRLDENHSTTSDREGRFECENLPAGEYWPRVHAEGYAPLFAPPLPVAEGETREGLDLVLQRARLLMGVVLSSDDRPVAHVEIQASHWRDPAAGAPMPVAQRPTWSTFSDPQGRFRFDDMPPENVRLRVNDVRHGRGTLTVRASDQDVELLLERPRLPRRVFGQLVRRDSDQPVGAARVALFRTMRPDASRPSYHVEHTVQIAAADGGVFELAAGAQGEVFQVRVDGPAILPTVSSLFVIPEEGEFGPLEIEISDGWRLRGVVVDEAKQPVGDVTVWLTGKTRSTDSPLAVDGLRLPPLRTAADGTFETPPLCPGTWHPDLQAEGFQETFPDPLEVVAQTPLAAVTWQLSGAASVRGRVHLPSGLPAPPMRAALDSFEEWDDGVSEWRVARWATVERGRLVFEGLEPGRYRLRVGVPADVLTAESNLQHNLRRVRAQGQPAALEPLLARLRKKAGRPAVRWESEEFELASGGIRWFDVDLDLAALGTVQGLFEVDGRPFSGGRVELRRSTGEPMAQTFSDGAGTFSFSCLPPDDYRLFASPHGRLPLLAFDLVRVVAGDLVFQRLELQLQHLTGQVTDSETGEPVANAALEFSLRGDDTRLGSQPGPGQAEGARDLRLSICRTAEDGGFETAPLPLLPLAVTVRAEWYLLSPKQALEQFRRSSAGALLVELDPAGRLQVEFKGEAGNQTRVARVRLRAAQQGSDLLPEAIEMPFPSLAPGDYELVLLDSEQNELQSFPVTIHAHQITLLEVPLR